MRFEGEIMEIPEKMKAAILFGRNDLRVIQKEVPQPGTGEVLIKVKSCAICGGDPKIIANGWPGSPPFGEFTPGHEYSGEIVKVGREVFGFKLGDRVAPEPHKGCGHCINCLRGLYTTCLNYGKKEAGHMQFGFTANGGYAEYAISHMNCLHKIPDTISDDSATLLTVGGAALYGIHRIGWIIPGETVVVMGPGPIGLMATQLAKVCGAGTVIVTGTRQSRLDIAVKIGATMVINSRNEDPAKIISQITDGVFADLVIEASGNVDAAVQAVELVKKSGRISYLGLYPEPAPINLFKVVMNNLKVAGGRGEGEKAIDKLIPLMADGRIKTEPLITHKFPLDKINEAFDTFINRKGNAIKVIINP